MPKKSSKRSKKKSKKKSSKKIKNNYNNSNNGMMTTQWGPSGWFFLHNISFGFPIENSKINKELKQRYYAFFYNLQFVLPCKKCRDNYAKNINEKDTKLDLSVFNTRESFKKWLFNLHNKVNKLTGKNTQFTYQDLNDKYEKLRAKCDVKSVGHVGCNIPLNGVSSISNLINVTDYCINHR